MVARAGVAVCVAGFIASTLGIDHAYWAMSAAVLVVHQGFDWIRTLQRGVERMLGTGTGLVLAGALLALHPQGLWLVATIALLQFTVELVVLRNYAIAVVFITPLALTMSSGGHPVDDIDELLLARGTDTLIGCVVALAVYLLIGRRHNAARLPEAIARTLDAIAATSRHLVLGAAITVAARAARRDLQIRAMAMLEAHDGGLGGSARERRSAERMWPAVVATEQSADRTLAACWAMERRDGGASAPEVECRCSDPTASPVSPRCLTNCPPPSEPDRHHPVSISCRRSAPQKSRPCGTHWCAKYIDYQGESRRPDRVPPDGQFIALAEADGLSSDDVFQLGRSSTAPTIRSRSSPSFALTVATRLPSLSTPIVFLATFVHRCDGPGGIRAVCRSVRNGQ